MQLPRWSRKDCLEGVLIVALVVVSVKVLYDLCGMLIMESHGPLSVDLPIYLTIGRGILNGLHPYTNLFESKPPGIFYLSAISLWLTGGTLFMRTLQAVNLLALPIGFAMFARRRGTIPMLCGFVFGGLLALRAHELVEGMQTEVFGLLPVTVYVSTLFFPSSWLRMSIAGLSIFLAVFFREPYILGILAASILVSKTTKQFLETFLMPSLFAGILFALTLLALHLFIPYFSVYLPGMLQDRIQVVGGDGPLVLRLLWIQRLFSTLTVYSTIPIQGYVLGTLWIFSIIAKERVSRLMGGLLVLACVMGAFGLGQFFVLFTLFDKASAYGLSPWQVLTDDSFLSISFLYLVGIVSYIGLLAFIGIKNVRALFAVLCGLAALPILSLSIGIGGYAFKYILYLTPAVLAVFALFVRRQKAIVISCLAIVLVIMSLTFKLRGESEQSLRTATDAIAASAALDRLMESCRLTTYASPSADSFAFSKYSPIGPIFTLSSHRYLGLSSPLYIQTYKNILKAPVLLESSSGSVTQLLPTEVEDHFSHQPPACAHGLQIPGFTVRFRS